MFKCKDILEENEHIVFVNKPINNDKEEILGYTAQAALIKSAIKDGANIIGIVADYGTGKSTLTELLCLENDAYHKNIIKINLWDTLSKHNPKGPSSYSSSNISNLSRSFIFQLANGASKNKWLSKYVSKRMSKNYGFLSFNPLSLHRFTKILILSFVVYVFPIAIKEAYTDISTWFELILNIASPWLAVAISLLGIIKTNIVFSKWDSQGKNTPEESDTFSLFCEVVEELCRSEKIKDGKKLIVVVEDLDRIKDKNIVLSFLKEIYKYSNLLPNNYKTEIVFIVSVMSEELLEQQPETDDFGQNIYSKIFDYSINLQSIHNDDYSQVAFDLLTSKKDLIERKINVTLTSSLPSEFSWIIKGEHLNLRDIKNRLNNCFSIYERLKLRENKNENLYISIEKCVAAAYLQDKYPKYMLDLCKKEEMFAEIVKKSVLRKNTKARGLAYSDKETFKKELITICANCDFAKNIDFIKDITDLLESEVISDDFKMYFYTYPKKGVILSAEQTLVKKILNSDQTELEKEEQESVNRLSIDSPDLVLSWCQELINQKLGLPITIFYSKTLFELCCKNVLKDTLSKIIHELNWEPHQLGTSEYYLGYIKSCQLNEYSDLIKNICDQVYTKFLKFDEVKIFESRKSIIKALGDDITLLQKLYFSEQMPIITKGEIDLIGNKEVLLEMINSTLITQENSEYIASSLMVEYNFKQIEKALEILTICLNANPNNTNLCFEFMNLNNIHDQKLFDNILSINAYENNAVVSYLNNSNLMVVDKACLHAVNKQKITGDFRQEILDQFFQNEYYYSYLFSVNVESLNFTTFTYSALNNTLVEIFADDLKLFMRIRKYLPVDFYSVYNEFFKEEYPFIDIEEISKVDKLSEAINLIDLSKVVSKTEVVILSNYFNFFYTSASDCYTILSFVLESNEISVNIKEIFFFSLDFSKIQYKCMSRENIDNILGFLQNIIHLSDGNSVLKYMNHTEFLDRTLEEIIFNDWCGDPTDDRLSEYFQLVSQLKQFSSTTLKIANKSYFDIPMWEEFEKAAEENNDKISVLISKTLRTQSFNFDYNAPYLSSKDYIGIFNSCQKAKELMKQNVEFLQFIIRSDIINEIEADDIGLFVKLRQPIGFIKHVFSTLTDRNLKIQYIFEMEALDTSEDSAAFLEFMSESDNLELLSDNKDLKNKVSFRLYNYGERIKYGNRVKEYFKSIE